MHLHIYAGIYRYMHASIGRCTSCIYGYMLLSFYKLSKSIYLYMLFECCACNTTILYEPELLFRIPSAAGCLGLLARPHIGNIDLQGDKGARCISRPGRGPRFLFNDQFYRFQPLARRCIIPEANTEQGIAVFLQEAFCSPLPGFQDQPCSHFLLPHSCSASQALNSVLLTG